jgi:glycosyltransferase involved in cell wall biosynthesis
MKILLITDTHASTGGGAEKYFFWLKKQLQQQPNLTIHSMGFGAPADSDAHCTVLSETNSKFLRQWWRMFFNPKKYFELRTAIYKINPDIIHLHNVKKYTISLFKAIADYPVIQTVHDYSPICPTGWNVHEDLKPCPTGLTVECWWRHRRDYNFMTYLGLLFSFNRMNKFLKANIKKFIAPSPMLEHYLRINQFGATVYLPPFRAEQGIASFSKMQAQQFLYVGQLEIQKGVIILLREFALAWSKNKNLLLKIAGTGSQKQFLMQQIKALKLENNVLLLGWVNPENLYEETTALIFPSIGLESFGMVITEAMGHARAVIGSNRGPTAWLIDNNETGLLFDPSKTGDLAEKILQLSSHPEQAKEFGQKAFTKANQFLTDAENIEKILTVYNDVIKSNPKKRALSRSF